MKTCTNTLANAPRTRRAPVAAFGLALIVSILTSAALFACDDDSSAIKEPTPTPTSSNTNTPPATTGTNTTDGGGPDGGPTDCVTNPQTHLEIINGCTDSVRITKNPVLPLLYPDGGLPPLP